MFKFLSRRHAVLAALGMAAGVTGWWLTTASGPGGDRSLQRVRESGVLRIGYAVEPPYALLQPDGTVSGESAEVAREVARQLGVQTRWILTRFEQLIDALELGRFDMVAAGMFISPVRARRVRFSRPTLRVRPGWLTVQGNPRHLGAYSQLPASPGVRVVVLAGSLEEGALQELSLPSGTVTPVPDAQSGLAAVTSGTADGLALSLPAVAHMAATGANRLVAVPADGPGSRVNLTALAFRHEDTALQRSVDEVLERFIGSAAHVGLLQHFGLSAADLPGAADVTP
jgi:polar amino acid transport system substrate-binding protein